MKIQLSLAAIAASLFFASCGNNNSEATTDANAADSNAVVLTDGTYNIDTTSAEILWTGRKIGGEHHGTIKAIGGAINVTGGNITNAMLNINMNSIAVTDLEGEEAAKLQGHLMSDDFFGTANFPEATINVTNVTMGEGGLVTIGGDLTIKGITHPFTTEAAAVKSAGNSISLKGKVVVDRTLYDVKYGSAKFFADIADKAINDEFDIEFSFTANM